MLTRFSPKPIAIPPINMQEIHLWRANLNLPEMELLRLRGLLSADEQQRADRFKFDLHRHRFIAARGTLREILSRYLDKPAAAIQFSYQTHGKPCIENSAVHFNMSDSNNLALYAVTLNREIGVDIEYMRERTDVESVAMRFFSEQERQAFQALPADKKRHAFFFGWTCKEAFLKAMGSGLSFPLEDFSVNINPDEPASLLEIHGDITAANNWFLHSFQPAIDYMAAIAVKGATSQVEFHNWC
jgi:4'-phosphopantetheinyl transferase